MTCTGDQLAGVTKSPPPVVLRVVDLSADIAPLSGISGIKFFSQGVSGENGDSIAGFGFPGGSGGSGSGLTASFNSVVWKILTQGNAAHGIEVQSLGGNGGRGGNSTCPFFCIAGPLTGTGGDGGKGGDGGALSVTSNGALSTNGKNAHGVFVFSQGGDGGHGGEVENPVGDGGDGGKAGNGGQITVNSSSPITTNGESSHGIFAQSQGGLGGGGGAGPLIGKGGAGKDAGHGGKVEISNLGAIATHGADSRGIFAQSVGGFDENTGGGGGGGSTGLFFVIGGSGGSGGAGGVVTVTNRGPIETQGAGASAILAESIGGGGGSGGSSVGLGFPISVAIGGSAGAGGNGGAVTVDSRDGKIDTVGDNSSGIQANSIGGGGGSGGFAISAAAGKSFSFAASHGGHGGKGGDGGTVTVTSHSTITTQGANAPGIAADSIGGGGGIGGYSISAAGSLGYSIALSWGGLGGDGGNGGLVSVGSEREPVTGGITTSGNFSHGIVAESTGMGGGRGGASISFAGSAFASPSHPNTFSFSLGGEGGKGGAGGPVTLYSASDITTGGDDAYGINARSVGGSGGEGGFSVAGGFSLIGEPLAISIGGAGGAGGSGSSVTVGDDAAPIQGRITTTGERAAGIIATSTGGKGGLGGGSVSGGISWVAISPVPYALSFSLGGEGGAGGRGGNVDVFSAADLTTSKGHADGIVASSVGGNGGRGGFSVAGGITSDGGLNLSIGGAGGEGAIGGGVTVHSSGAIRTSGDDASGIRATSLGGNGGDGGWSVAGAINNLQSGKNIDVSIGGGGGDGGRGGLVTVVNSGTIDTIGNFAPGIFAQSIGGNGGSGGFSGAGSLAIASAHPGSGTLNVNFSLGGGGGNGNVGGGVEVKNYYGITTNGRGSYGINATSIGGGGGAGGNSFTGVLDLASVQKGAVVDVGIAIGGKGGNGNVGGTVNVKNEGRIETGGYDSHGIYALSLGGGGGDGGKANNFSLSLDTSCFLLIACKDDAKAKVHLNFNVAVGGNGGGASDGGSVTVSNTGEIVTQKAGSNGIVAQSIGGGGGNGGNGGGGFGFDDKTAEYIETVTGLVPYIANPKVFLTDWQVAIGGSGGSSGNGGTVKVINSGSIITYGAGLILEEGKLVPVDAEGGYGILAQSVGGGGGTAIARGGDADVGLTGKLGIGGAGGASGDGGKVTVMNSGQITTWGIGAHAIVAQSIGGGGGIGGSVNRTPVPWTDIGVGLNLGYARGGGNGGNGGDVEVHSEGTIITNGGGAFGILAQSVGGGGGIADDRGLSLASSSLGTLFGSVGGKGSAGAVTVTHSGNITTLGDVAHGIFAQSGGGAEGEVVRYELRELFPGGPKVEFPIIENFDGRGSNVDVTLTGHIIAHGRDSFGILAQSRGDTGAGNIAVTINSGGVWGGSGAGAAVKFLDGKDNTLLNRGAIAALSGDAILGGAGNETITNYGTVTGSVRLGAGRNAFNNNAAAIFNAGAAVDLGAGNTFTNAGTLSPGGSGAPLTTALNGNLVQTSVGTVEAEVYGDGRHDQVQVNGGSASLDGTLSVVRRQGLFRDGTKYRVFDAPGTQGISGAFANVLLPAPRPLLNFDVNQSPHAVEVDVHAARVSTVATNRTYQRIAQHLDRIMPSATGDLAVALAEFQALPAGGFDRAFASLGPMAYDSLTRATVGSTGLYTQSLQRRLEAVRVLNRTASGAPAADPVRLAAAETDTTLVPILGTYRLSQPQAKNGLWATGFGQWGDQETTPGFTGFTTSTGGVTAGYDYTFGDHLTAGLSVGYSDTDVDMAANQGGGRIQGVFPSLYASYFTTTAYVEGALSYGHNWYKNDRRLLIGGIERTAQSEHQSNAFAAYLGAGYAYPLGDWAVGPVAALRYVYLAEGGFQENGADSLNLTVASRATNSLVSELGVRVSGTKKIQAGTLIPDLSLLWSYDFDVDNPVLTTTYAGAPGAAFSIRGQPAAQNGLLVRSGLTFVHPAGWSTTLRYAGEFRDGYQSQAGFGLEVRFQF